MKWLKNTVLFIRTVLFYLVFWAFTVIYGTACLLCYPFPYKIRFFVISQWSRIMLWWLHLSCGVSYDIVGREHAPKETCIILSKHSSVWETLALPLIFHMPSIVAKKSLLKIPFFGWMLAMCEPIAIDRKQGSSAMKQVIRQGKYCLDRQRKILIFPEGTRVPPGETKEYKIGGVLIAKRYHQKILPVAHNAGLFWSDKSFLIHPGKVKVIIGELVDTQGYEIEVLNQTIRDWIEAHSV